MRLRNSCARYFAVAATCLLVLSVSAAAAQIGGHAATQRVGTRGQTVTQGPLVAFLRDNPITKGHSPAGYGVAATAIRVETYSQEPQTHPLGVHEAAQEGNETYQAATLKGVENFGGYHYDVLPTSAGSATATLTSNCTTMAPSQVGSVEVDSQISKPSPDNHITVGTAHAVTWQGCNEAPAKQKRETIQIQGEFVIVAWGWNSTVTTSDGTNTPIPSGPGICPNDPNGVAYSVGVLSCDHQRYFYVHQGTLTMDLGADTPYQAFLGAGTHVKSEHSLILQEARGQLGDGIHLAQFDGQEVDVTGLLTATLSGSGTNAPLEAQLDGQVTQLTVNGADQAWAASTASTPIPRGALGVLGWFVGGVGAVVVTVPGVRRVKAARAHRLESLLSQGWAWHARGQYDVAHRIADKILDLKPNLGQAHVLAGASLFGLGEYSSSFIHHAAAADLLRRGARVDLDLVAENAFGAALTAAASTRSKPGAAGEVGRLLGEALGAKPSLRLDLHRHPELGPHLGAFQAAGP